jgi:hypothetical protein
MYIYSYFTYHFYRKHLHIKVTWKLFAAHPSAAHAALETNFICVQLTSKWNKKLNLLHISRYRKWHRHPKRTEDQTQIQPRAINSPTEYKKQTSWLQPCINDISNFIFPTNAHHKNVELSKHIKIMEAAPTCFGLQRNHHQGATAST